MRSYKRAPIEARLWAMVDKTPACWLWTGHRNGDGYGTIGVGGTTMYAHRVAYLIAVGPIGSGLEIDHLCRTPSCVNPRHLDPVTHAENLRRTARQTCRRGHLFTEANIYYRPDTGQRQCRECVRVRSQKGRAA